MMSADREALALAPTSPLLLALTDSRARAASLAIRAASVVFVTLLTAVAAQISVPLPFTPVPLTLQPMVVLLGGAVLGSRLGLASQLALPRGRHRGPPGVRCLAPAAAGRRAPARADRRIPDELPGRRVRRRLACRARLRSPLPDLGPLDGRRAHRHLRIGHCWLALELAPAHPGSSLALALQTGLYPFVALDLVKLFVAAAVMPGLWRMLGRGYFRPSTRKN